MTTALVLVAAILVLGGVIAMVGDRLGMKVGKARLSLLGLRPRQTATVITVMTGTIISASTFGVLFAVSEQLRRGVFDYEEIQADRRQAEAERDAAIEQQGDARRRLGQINRSLRQSITQRNRTEAQLKRIQTRQQQTQTQLSQTQTQLNRSQAQLGITRRQFEQIATRFRQAQALLASVSQQAAVLRSEIQALEADRRRQIAQRDQDIAERDRAIAEREQALRKLEEQRTQLAQDVQTLEDEFRRLRLGNPALLRNQTLASGVVRVVTPAAAPQAVDELLREANRFAQERIRPSATTPTNRVIQITNSQVEQLINQIQGGQDYVVTILSAGNYVVGEPCVLAGEACIQVYAVANLNQVVFRAGEVVATTQANPFSMNNEGLIDRLNLLIAAAQFRARQAGIVGDVVQIADGRPETVVAFFEQLQQLNQPVEIQAIAAATIYTADPVRLELVAVQQGQILFGTQPTEREGIE